MDLPDLPKIALRAEGVRIRAGGRRGRILIENVSMRIHAGERVGILGPSGSGKSQFLDRALGLIPLESDEGRIEWPLAGRSSQSIAAVFQTHALFDSLTIRGNIQAAIKGSSTAAAADEWLEAVGLDSGRVGDLYPADLSGGMQRRATLARALAQRPALLVLDEPLTGLDGESARLVIETLEREHKRAQGRMAILAVTHDYPFAARFCDKVFWLDAPARRLREIPEWTSNDESGRMRIIEKWRTGAPADSAAEDGPDKSAQPNGINRLDRSDRSDQPDQPDRSDSPVPPQNPSRSRRASQPFGSLGSFGSFRSWKSSQSFDFLSFLDSIPSPWALLRGIANGPITPIRMGRDTLEQWLRASILAAPFIALIYSLLGFLLTLQSERLLAPLGLASRIPEAVAIGVIEGIGPLLLALLMGGRTGSAMAAELSSMRLDRQTDQWRLLGYDLGEVLLAPRFWALALAFPPLLLLGEFIALGAGWLFYRLVPAAGLTASAFWEGVKLEWTAPAILHGCARAGLDGALLAILAFSCAMAPKRSQEDCSRAATQTVVFSAVLFLIVELLWSWLRGIPN